MMYYKVYGSEIVDVVVEIGLGASAGEWEQFAMKICDGHGVLVYERCGIGRSGMSDNPRTPCNIAKELHELLTKIKHEEKLTFVGHSQGGLYAYAFCCMYPEMVKKLVLVDPLSPTDNDFKKKLSPREYKKSGVDKTASFKMIKVFLKLGMKKYIKKQMLSAPPFYYYSKFTENQSKEITDCYINKTHLDTCIEEYVQSHDEKNISEIKKIPFDRTLPLVLITHDSELAIKENMEFGNNSREFAKKVEMMWQEIMSYYLSVSDNTKHIKAKKSTHYIHLTEPEIIMPEIIFDFL